MNSVKTNHPVGGILFIHPMPHLARLIRHAGLAVAVCLSPLCLAPSRAAVGDARVAKWKDDRVGVFLLMFDDGWPGQVEVGIPELQKRGLTATFYMVPDKGEYKAFAAKWAEAEKGGGVVYGVHTMTHQGVKDLEHARWEIGECARIIRDVMQAGGKPDRLLSFAKPGVGPGKWNITADEQDLILKENNLVDRPPFKGHGAVYHWKTLEEMTALADKAVAEKEMNHLILHGVERIGAKWQDFWPLKQEIFLPLLDHLKARQDSRELWVTDHVSWHQYKTGRDSASVKTLEVAPDGIRLELNTQADPAFYDHPLTLVVEVPASWRECSITQGETILRITAVNGFVTFDAVPDGRPIGIRPAAP